MFVTLGEAEQLRTFLEVNPAIPKELALVDDYAFGAYKEAGFGTIQDNAAAAKDAKLRPPGIEFGKWFTYLKNVARLSPVPKDLAFGSIPEGVLRLGGTFVIDGDEVLYSWSDKIPGDHPDVNEVQRIALRTPATKSGANKAAPSVAV